MRVSVVAGLFACVVLATVSSTTGSAEAQSLVVSQDFQAVPTETVTLANVELVLAELAAAQPTNVEPKPAVHIIGENENLSKIAEQHGTTWVRLYNKNVQIAHPDLLTVGAEVILPLPEETLAERPLPQIVAAPVTPAPVVPAPRQRVAQGTKPTVVARRPRGGSAGNTYTAGYCTWYAKNRRPDLPNNLGNANTWVSRAAAQGIPTGNTPRVGAIGQQGMHVVYVERVNGNGTVTISEMNYSGLYSMNTRTVSASSFRYIY